MMLHVMYNDGRFDLVNQTMLDLLLASSRLAGFMRSSGWAFVGRDPIRVVRDPSYRGDERRNS